MTWRGRGVGLGVGDGVALGVGLITGVAVGGGVGEGDGEGVGVGVTYARVARGVKGCSSTGCRVSRARVTATSTRHCSRL